MYLHIISTKSESGDEYSYTVKSDKNREEASPLLNDWLQINACDKDEDECYEYIETVTTINLNDIDANIDGEV
jgi:hypothetical protein